MAADLYARCSLCRLYEHRCLCYWSGVIPEDVRPKHPSRPPYDYENSPPRREVAWRSDKSSASPLARFHRVGGGVSEVPRGTPVRSGGGSDVG